MKHRSNGKRPTRYLVIDGQHVLHSTRNIHSAFGFLMGTESPRARLCVARTLYKKCDVLPRLRQGAAQ